MTDAAGPEGRSAATREVGPEGRSAATREVGTAHHPVVSAAVGAAAIVGGGALVIYRGAKRLPIVGDVLQRTRADLTVRGDQVIAASTAPVKALIQTIAVQVVDLVLDELDITALVRDKVDLAGLANQVIDDIDLPGIIRTSTASVTTEVMTDVRGQSERADDVVAAFVDRVLGRNGDLR
ncbi:MAG: hypothetical protein ACSLE6_14035 [Mycobacterium sp.]